MRSHRTAATNEGIQTVSIIYDISHRADIRSAQIADDSASAREISRLRRELASALMERRVADATASQWMQRYQVVVGKVRDMRDALPSEILYSDADATEEPRRIYLLDGEHSLAS